MDSKALVAFFLVALMVTGCTRTGSATQNNPQATTFSIPAFTGPVEPLQTGQTARIEGPEQKLLVVTLQNASARTFYEYPDLLDLATGSFAKEGAAYYVFDAQVGNPGQGSITLRPDRFFLVDSKGFQYSPLHFSNEKKQEPYALLPGSKQNIRVLFEVPALDGISSVVYDAGDWSSEKAVARWSFDPVGIKKDERPALAVAITGVDAKWTDVLHRGRIGRLDFQINNTGDVGLQPGYDFQLIFPNGTIAYASPTYSASTVLSGMLLPGKSRTDVQFVSFETKQSGLYRLVLQFSDVRTKTRFRPVERTVNLTSG